MKAFFPSKKMTSKNLARNFLHKIQYEISYCTIHNCCHKFWKILLYKTSDQIYTPSTMHGLVHMTASVDFYDRDSTIHNTCLLYQLLPHSELIKWCQLEEPEDWVSITWPQFTFIIAHFIKLYIPLRELCRGVPERTHLWSLEKPECIISLIEHTAVLGVLTPL